MSINIAFVDDHDVVRQSIADSLERSGNFSVVLHARNGKDLLDRLQNLPYLPEICLMDIQMPILNGYETLKLLRPRYPSLKVMIFSQFIEDFTIRKAFKAGANGVFSKDDGLVDLLNALQILNTHNLYFSKDCTVDIVKAVKNKNVLLPNLTDREMEYLKLCCEDITNSQIAERMHITTKTTEAYSSSLCHKLNIKNRTGLAVFALKTGLVPFTH